MATLQEKVELQPHVENIQTNEKKKGETGSIVADHAERKLIGKAVNTVLSVALLTRFHKFNWKDHVNKMVYASNATKHDSTGYSPYFLLFVREPVLPIDSLFQERKDAIASCSKYVQNWKEAMNEAYSIAKETSAKAAMQGNQQADKKPEAQY